MDITKQKSINIVREILVTQMNHWSLFPLYVMLVEILGDVIGTGKPHPLFWLLYGCIPFLLYICRTFFNKFWLLFLVHAAVIGFMFIMPAEHLVIRVIHIAIGIGYVVLSAYLWSTTSHRKDTKLPSLASVAISAVMLLILNNQGHTDWNKFFVTILIIVLGLYFIIYYIEQYQNFLTVNNSSAGHIPAKEMFKSGMGLVIGYTSVSLLILVLISNIEWLKVILQLLKNAIYSFFHMLFSYGPEPTPVTTTQTENIQMEMIEDMGPYEDLGETFWFWQVLEKIFEYIFVLAIIALLVAAIVYIVRFIIKKLKEFQPNTNINTVDLGEVYDVHEKCDVIKRNNRLLKIPFLQTDPRERIRHLYKKRILTSKESFSVDGNDTSLLNRYTARESSRLLERDELAFIYEKARYSNAECDNEDVKQMRNACK